MNKNEKSKSETYLEYKNKSLRSSLIVSRIFATIMTIGFFALGFAYLNEHNDSAVAIADLQSKYDYLESEYNVLVDHYDDFNNTINELISISDELDKENQELAQTNDSYYEELSELRSRAELYDKYDYAIVDESGTRTDITYDQLRTLEDLVNDSSINDEDLFLSWIMTESGGKENASNATSTAKGYGQFLNSTSKFVYTDLLGNTDWNSNVAYDGDCNLEMMVAYVDYLYKQSGGDLYQVIRCYRGKDDISSYVAKINSFLAYKDKSVQMIAQSLN